MRPPEHRAEHILPSTPAPHADDILVRPYAPGDKSRLLTFIRRAWSYKPDVDAQFENRWSWNASARPLLVAEDRTAHAIVGVCAFGPFTLQAREQGLPSAWFVDCYVLPEYQGKGLGRRLTERVQDAFSRTASLSQTAMVYRVFARMGWSARARWSRCTCTRLRCAGCFRRKTERFACRVRRTTPVRR